jgi:hypothetical protein
MPRQEPVDDTRGVPLVFNCEYQRSNRPGSELAEGGDRSLAHAIASEVSRRGEEAGKGSPVGSVSRWAGETAVIGKWAREQHLIIPPAEIERLPLVTDATAEHKVYYDAESDRAVKVTEPGGYGTAYHVENGRLLPTPASPWEYARRWEDFNRLFDDDVRIEGFTDGEGMDPFTKERPFGMVISQPWYDAVPAQEVPRDGKTTGDRIAERLDALGFKPAKGFAQWYRPEDGMYVGDARDDNFVLVKNASGEVVARPN